MLSVSDLRTEYAKHPLGIDSRNPRFSWKLTSTRQGVVQTSYRILVQSEGRQIWDSGEVLSPECRFVRYEGAPLQSRQTLTWTVEVSAASADGVVEHAKSMSAGFEMGLLSPADWKARWMEAEGTVDEEKRNPAVYLRKTFEISGQVKCARLYATAHGLYDFSVNGRPGTRDRFLPGFTSYFHRIQYQTFDIRPLLRIGKNVLCVRLADGWWRGTTGGTLRNNFGTKLHFFGQLELTYEDGRREILPTDESWRCSTGGLLAADMQMGEIFDARREPEGWQNADFNDGDWKPMHEVPEDEAADFKDCRLIASSVIPVREKESFPAAVFTDRAGNTVLDFGQNIAGNLDFTLRKTAPGQKVTFLFGEDLKDGVFSQENIRDTAMALPAFQEIDYLCAGKDREQYHPVFSVFGFRYVLIRGYDMEPDPEDFRAYAMYSDMERTGTFSCSDPLLNQLVKNAVWSMKGNFLDVAVDCPTRERNAWTGDAQIFAQTSCLLFQTYPFYEKWLQDQAIEQYASGKVGITFPSTSSPHRKKTLEKMQKTNPLAALAGPAGEGSIGEDCAGWGDAAAWIPHVVYAMYGDRTILEHQYDTAKRYVDHMLQLSRDHNPLYEEQPWYHHRGEDGILDADFIFDTKMHFGEWCEPIPRKSSEASKEEAFKDMIRRGNPLVATAYMCRSCGDIAAMAKALSRKEEAQKYQRLSERIAKVYDRYFIAGDGSIEEGHQAAYVRALAFGLAGQEKRERVVEQLLSEIRKADFHLNTGFLSTPFLLPVLCEEGYPDIAYRILEQKSSPSWLSPILHGATTIPEYWDGFETHHGSLNHYSYGAVVRFLMSYTAGIREDPEFPGFTRFTIQPVPDPNLSSVSASYLSPYGKITSSWELRRDRFTIHCTIPVGTTCRLLMPNGNAKTLGSGQYRFYCRIPAKEVV